MASPLKENNTEDNILESLSEMTALQDMLNQICESTDSAVPTTNTNLSTEDQSLNQAIVFSEVTESVASTTASSTRENGSASTAEASETLNDVLNSSGKCLSIALNSQTTSTAAAFTASGPDAAFLQSTTGQQVDTVQQVNQPRTSLCNTAARVSTKKPHIMISYNRSCQNICMQIRNRLKALRYIVWMDIDDMRNNFIEGMAKAISNSYMALLCLNNQYDHSPWCRKEAESISIRQIDFIPCFMQDPYTPADWVALLLGANIRVDFSDVNQFEEAFQDLLKRIRYLEEDLAISPRESLPSTPTINPTTSVTPSSTIETFDAIFRHFKTWVEENRDNLRRTDGQQSARLIHELARALENDSSAPDDENKRQLLQQLLSATSYNRPDLLPRLVHTFTASNSLMVKGLLFIMALWAATVVFNRP